MYEECTCVTVRYYWLTGVIRVQTYNISVHFSYNFKITFIKQKHKHICGYSSQSKVSRETKLQILTTLNINLRGLVKVLLPMTVCVFVDTTFINIHWVSTNQSPGHIRNQSEGHVPIGLSLPLVKFSNKV